MKNGKYNGKALINAFGIYRSVYCSVVCSCCRRREWKPGKIIWYKTFKCIIAGDHWAQTNEVMSANVLFILNRIEYMFVHGGACLCPSSPGLQQQLQVQSMVRMVWSSQYQMNRSPQYMENHKAQRWASGSGYVITGPWHGSGSNLIRRCADHYCR